MSQAYELTRRIIARGTFKTMTAVCFRESGGAPIYRGDARMGYLAAEVPFVNANNHPAVTFGPNRSFAPSAHCLRRASGDLIAEIRHGLVQSAWGGKGYEVIDGSGAPLFKLVPGETFKAGSGQRIGELFSDALYALRGEDVLGHTGSETAAGTSDSATAKAARRMGRLVSELPGALANIVKEEVLGKNVERKEAVVARFTPLESAALEPRLIFAILMFKVHYHSMRGA